MKLFPPSGAERLVAPRHGGNLWAAAQKRGIPPEEIIDFSADLNPWAEGWVPPDLIQEAWRRARHYPDPVYRRFREAAAAWEGVEPESILPGNGTADLIHLISRWRKGARAFLPVPTFTEYARAVLSDGGTIASWPLPEERGFDGSGLPPVLERAPADLLFLCNPNNPTGRLWPREILRETLDLCEQKGIFWVADEAYLDLVAEEDRHSLVSQAGRRRNGVVLRSLTKVFGLPGLRIGYAVGHPETVKALEAIQPPWPVNTLAAEVGTWLMGTAVGKLAESRSLLESARTEMVRGLASVHSLRLFPSDANFLLGRLSGDSGLGVGEVADRLEGRGILIRRCDDFQGLEPDRFLRVAVRRPDDNHRLVELLREILGHAR